MQPEWARGQLVAWLFGAFAALALALASVGLYSVVAYTVVQRTNEFGIRIALGAKRGHVLGIVFRSTVACVGTGCWLEWRDARLTDGELGCGELARSPAVDRSNFCSVAGRDARLHDSRLVGDIRSDRPDSI